jgi:hypothetical protein
VKGNKIIVTDDPRGVYLAGVIGPAALPGSIMEVDPTVAVDVQGRKTWRYAQPGADGGATLVAILIEDAEQGKTALNAYVAGTFGRLYVPLPGEDMNVLLVDATGTGTSDTYPVGGYLEVKNNTGRFCASYGSPVSTPFRTMEDMPQPDVAALVWSQATGM